MLLSDISSLESVDLINKDIIHNYQTTENFFEASLYPLSSSAEFTSVVDRATQDKIQSWFSPSFLPSSAPVTIPLRIQLEES